MGCDRLKRLEVLARENRRLRRALSDLISGKLILTEAAWEKSERLPIHAASQRFSIEVNRHLVDRGAFGSLQPIRPAHVMTLICRYSYTRFSWLNAPVGASTCVWILWQTTPFRATRQPWRLICFQSG